MQIVIDITENQYKIVKDYIETVDDENLLANVIANGIVLPKGHGNLIDADAIIAETIERMKYPENHRYMECVIAHLHLAPIIIEAESEVEK